MERVSPPPPAAPPTPSAARRALGITAGALRWTARGLVMVMMVIIPVPVVSFLDKTRRRHQKNLPAQIVRGEQRP